MRAPQIIFKAIGGPYNGQPLYIQPPIVWEQTELVMQAEHGDRQIWHKYRFSRVDYTARYLGEIVPNQKVGV